MRSGAPLAFGATVNAGRSAEASIEPRMRKSCMPAMLKPERPSRDYRAPAGVPDRQGQLATRHLCKVLDHFWRDATRMTSKQQARILTPIALAGDYCECRDKSGTVVWVMSG